MSKFVPKKNRIQTLILLIVISFTVAMSAHAQSLAGNALTTAPSARAQESAALAGLPEADTILYFNPRRILSEAAPRVLPENDLEKMRQGLAEMKQGLGVDPSHIDYVVLQVRFKKPGADLSFSLPEFMLVVKGDFDGAALMQIARQASKGELHEESYGSKMIGIMPIEDVAKEAAKTPMLKPFSEVAVSLLNGDTIAIGTTNYVKAAIDATEGKNRISPDLLNSVLRDPTALVSAAGSPLTAFAKTFALLGTENNPRAPKCDTRMGDYYAAITMDATSFKLRGAMNADNPDTAKIIKSLISMGLQAALSSVKDSKAQAALNGLVITPTETEVLLQADVSQQAVADFIRDQTKPKKPETTVSPDVQAKPRPKRRPARRPRTKG